MLALEAELAGVVRDVMGDEHPVSYLVVLHLCSDLNDITCDLMAKHPRRLFDAVPFHDVTAADSACDDFNEQLLVTNGRDRLLLDADVIVVIVHGDFHGFHMGHVQL